MKERDLDKTITGLLFNSEFLFGLLQLLCFAGCVAGAVIFFIKMENIFAKIFLAAMMLFFSGAGLESGLKHVRVAWKDWRDYVKGE